jgi:hypothetical protein
MTTGPSETVTQVQRYRSPVRIPRKNTWYYRGHSFNLNHPDLMCHDVVFVKARRKWHVPFLLLLEYIRRPKRRSIILMPE